MALAISNAFSCSKPQLAPTNRNLEHSLSMLSPSFVRFSRPFPVNKRVIFAAASAAGSSSPESDLNPYEVLGVSSIEGFDKVKAVYTKKRKEAERIGDEATAARLEKAYDKLMMAQLTSRKKGVAYGSFKVSKDIKYADKQPIVPWGPRFSKSSVQDMRINLAIAGAFKVSKNILMLVYGTGWTINVVNAGSTLSGVVIQSMILYSIHEVAWIVIKRNANYKPLQFLAFAFVYRIFEKLKSYEPLVSPTYTEEGEDDGRALRMGKRLLRSLALVFGSIAFASLAYTGILNLIEYVGSYIPTFLFNNQELLVTTSSAVILYILGSYYR